MPASRATAACLCALLARPAAAGVSNAEVPILRGLHHLNLLDTAIHVRSVFPPRSKWVKRDDPDTELTTVVLTHENSKDIPPDIERLRLGFRLGLLLYIQAIYTKEHTRRRPIDKVVTEYAVDYGEPRRKGEAYFWQDWRTALRVSEAELPSPKGKGVELRTSVELMSRLVFEPGSSPEHERAPFFKGR